MRPDPVLEPRGPGDRFKKSFCRGLNSQNDSPIVLAFRSWSGGPDFPVVNLRSMPMPGRSSEVSEAVPQRFATTDFRHGPGNVYRPQDRYHDEGGGVPRPNSRTARRSIRLVGTEAANPFAPVVAVSAVFDGLFPFEASRSKTTDLLTSPVQRMRFKP